MCVTVREQSTTPDHVRTSFPSRREWLKFTLWLILVVGIELTDDLTRGTFAPRPIGPTQVNANRVVDFERSHGFWVEPALQRFFERAHHILGLTIQWDEIVPLANSLYGIAHGVVTVIFAIWVFWRRRLIFPFVRN